MASLLDLALARIKLIDLGMNKRLSLEPTATLESMTATTIEFLYILRSVIRFFKIFFIDTSKFMVKYAKSTFDANTMSDASLPQMSEVPTFSQIVYSAHK